MATHTVRQSGGDFSTLASALSDAGTVDNDTISIEGTWSIDDTSAATVQDVNITIVADADSKVDPKNLASPTHYRLRHSGGSHCITINANGAVVDGLEIQQATTTGNSDECIRITNRSLIIIKNCWFWAAQDYDYQDGVYHEGGARGSVVTVENCFFSGFGRSGVNTQFLNLSGLITTNVNSCTGYNNGTVDEGNDGGFITAYRNSFQRDVDLNVFNCVGVGNDTFFEDYDENGENAVVWNIHNSIDSDGSIARRDVANANCLANRTPTDSSSPGAGDWVMFTDITGVAPFDLTLQASADNDANEMHTSSTGAGMTMPATDLQGDARTSPYDCGADAISGVQPTGGVYVGSNEITSMYLGTTSISKAYVGSTQIFPKT